MTIYTAITAPSVHEIMQSLDDLIWPQERAERALLTIGSVESLAIHAHQLGASDLHIQTGEPAKIKIHGRMFAVMTRPVEANEAMFIASIVYGPGVAAWFLNGKDFTKGVSVRVKVDPHGVRYTVGRTVKPTGDEQVFRFRWQGAATMVDAIPTCQLTAHCVERHPPRQQELCLEPELVRHLFPRNGLVLVTGRTGEGKTRTLAGVTRGMLENPNFNGKILEFASPYEYDFTGLAGPNSMYAVSDIAENGGNYKTGAAAMRGALHRRPEVIIAPEVRDVETAALALQSGLMGHVTYATIHSNSVLETIDRFLVMFPLGERDHRAIELMQSLRLIVSCKLVRSLDGKRIQLREFLPFTATLRRQMLEQPYKEWAMLAESNLELYGQSFVDAATTAQQDRLISQEVAQGVVEERDEVLEDLGLKRVG